MACTLTPLPKRSASPTWKTSTGSEQRCSVRMLCSATYTASAYLLELPSAAITMPTLPLSPDAAASARAIRRPARACRLALSRLAIALTSCSTIPALRPLEASSSW